MKNRMKRLVAIVIGGIALVGVNTILMDTQLNTEVENTIEIVMNTEIEKPIKSEMDIEIENPIEPSIDTEYGSVGDRVNGNLFEVKMSAYVVVDEDTGRVTAATGCDGYKRTCEVTVRVYYQVGEDYYYSESTNSTAQIGGTSATITKTDAKIVGAKGIHKVIYNDDEDYWTWTPTTSVGFTPEDAQKE